MFPHILRFHVSRDTAGAVFHKELARELVEFILPIVEREGGTMSLMDIYCVFNRARGVGKEGTRADKVPHLLNCGGSH